MNKEELYKLVDTIPENERAAVARFLRVKSMPTEGLTDEEIKVIRDKYGNGDFYKYATTDELKAGFQKVNEMIMYRKEFNEVFDVTVSEERWVALKTYLRDLNQPENMPTADEIEMFRLHELEKSSPDYVTYTLDELMECYIDDYDEVSAAKVMKEDLLQMIDCMSAEHLKLVSEYVMKLEDD